MHLIVIRRQTMILLALLVLLVLGGLLYVVLAADSLHVLQVIRPSAASDDRRIPIYSVQREDKHLALTFDATWGGEHTAALLKAMADRDIRATFFLTNVWMEDYPDKVREIFEAGHEIGLHSASHPDMSTLSEEEIRAELRKNLDMVKSICPDARPTLFRPPFGSYTDQLLEVAEDELQLTTVQWSVDSLDWKEVTPEYVFNRVITLMHPGAIILFHNDAAPTAEALPGILEHLEDAGYRPVTVSELLHPSPYIIDHRGQQVPGES